jgi:hypothetical protein
MAARTNLSLQLFNIHNADVTANRLSHTNPEIMMNATLPVTRFKHWMMLLKPSYRNIIISGIVLATLLVGSALLLGYSYANPYVRCLMIFELLAWLVFYITLWSDPTPGIWWDNYVTSKLLPFTVFSVMYAFQLYCGSFVDLL